MSPLLLVQHGAPEDHGASRNTDLPAPEEPMSWKYLETKQLWGITQSPIKHNHLSITPQNSCGLRGAAGGLRCEAVLSHRALQSLFSWEDSFSADTTSVWCHVCQLFTPLLVHVFKLSFWFLKSSWGGREWLCSIAQCMLAVFFFAENPAA